MTRAALPAYDRAWQQHGACKANPDLWAEPDKAPEALHRCLRHCKVLAECRQWAGQWGDWDSVVVAGVHWAASYTNGAKAKPRDSQHEQWCGECLSKHDCVMCGSRLVNRPPAARTCSEDCSRQLANRRERTKAGQKRRRRQCRVCRSSLPARAPSRQVLCVKAQCQEIWQARQSRATTARARQRKELVSA